MKTKTNIIELSGAKIELERAVAGLTMEDFFLAVKSIRNNGVVLEDEEHGGHYAVKVNPAELNAFDPNLCEADDSLEGVLYGVFMAVKEPGEGCETREDFDAAWESMGRDRECRKDSAMRAYLALYETLEGWLRFWVERIMEEQVKTIGEEDVLALCNELDKDQKVN